MLWCVSHEYIVACYVTDVYNNMYLTKAYVFSVSHGQEEMRARRS